MAKTEVRAADDLQEVGTRTALDLERPDPDELAEWWARWDELAAEIRTLWPEGDTIEDVMRDIRRDL